MTKQEKVDIALWYIKKHGNLTMLEAVFDTEQKLKQDITLSDIEEVLKIETDSSFVCNRCLHRGDGWCTLAEKTQCKHPDFSKFCFRYRYWRKIKNREEKIK